MLAARHGSPPPPEWAPHEALWIGFPSDPELWLGDLKPAEREVAAFAEAIHADGRGEKVWLVAAHEGAAETARELCPFAEVIVEPFGDIWLRDTGPIVLGRGKDRRAQGFGFNGWGGKYELDGDHDIGERLAMRAALPFARADWILEGGAIDGDGSGTVITTEQCLLNPNRNTLTREATEQRLLRDLGFERVVWLGSGLMNDHTDGHVDNLARFVAPGTRRHPDRGQGRSQRGGLQGRGASPQRGKARRRYSTLPRRCPRRRRRNHPGELHELLPSAMRRW